MSGAAPVGQRALAGIAMAVLATVFFSLTDAGSKHLALLGLPAVMAMWGRYIFQALATTLVVLPLGGWSVLRTGQPWFHGVRGLMLVTSSMLVFFSLKYMPLGEFTAISMIAPLVVTLLAGIFWGELVSPLRWMLLAGGFVGTLVIIRPGAEGFSPVLLLPLVHVATNCAFQLLTSRLARTENPLTMNFYTGWVGALAITPLLPWAWVTLESPWLWAVMVGMGVCGAVGHFMLILAYQRTPAARLMPYMYMHIAFAMLCGWWLFDHVPDGWAFVGMGLIALCGVASAWLTLAEQRPT